MTTTILRYERTLDPHEFCLSTDRVFQIPPVCEVILFGTDEEFNTRAKELSAQLRTPQFDLPISRKVHSEDLCQTMFFRSRRLGLTVERATSISSMATICRAIRIRLHGFGPLGTQLTKRPSSPSYSGHAPETSSLRSQKLFRLSLGS